MAKFTFQLEEPETTALGKETGRADPWANTTAEVVFSSGQRVWYLVGPTGEFHVTPPVNEKLAVVAQVRTKRPHRHPVHWRILNPSEVVAKRGERAVVKLGTRLRLSLVSFNYPFAKKTKNRFGPGHREHGLNKGLMQDARNAGFDDVTCVYGLKRFGNGVILPDGVPSHSQWRALIAGMHELGIEIYIGYSFGSLGEKTGEYERDYAAWLNSIKNDDSKIVKHVEGIVKYLKQKKLNFDGLCFDIESNAIRADGSNGHARQLRLLFRTAAKVLGEHGMTVSFFTGPFNSQTDEVTGAINLQRFDYVHGLSDFLARPMCYDGLNARDYSVVEESIKYALRPISNNDGGGLHPSQLQMALWEGLVTQTVTLVPDSESPNDPKKAKRESKHNPNGATMEEYCKNLLRPNRVGLCVYTLPTVYEPQKAFLKKCADFNKWLNGTVEPFKRPGEPFHSPQPLKLKPD